MGEVKWGGESGAAARECGHRADPADARPVDGRGNSQTLGTSRSSATRTPAALDGIRILDFTQMMLGPFATQLLADLGADVIKVERPSVGEWLRGLPMGGEVLQGDSAAFLSMNRSKRSIAIDLKHPKSRGLLLDLAAQCDVVVENFRPGVMDRLGLGYDDFREVRPDVIYASGSGWGQDSELARKNRPGQDLLIQAMCGVMFNTARASDPPTACGTPIADVTTAQSLASGILAALLVKERRGIGQRVEVDLYSSMLAAQCQENFVALNQGTTLERSASGIATTWNDAPYGAYETKDGWIVIAMCPLSKLGPLVGDVDVATLDPWHDRDLVKRRVESRIRLQPTAIWEALFAEHDVWACRIRTTAEAMDELEAIDPNRLVVVEHPRIGPIKSIACAIGLSATPADVRSAPPLVGQHTEEVIGELLGEQRAAALRAEGLFK